MDKNFDKKISKKLNERQSQKLFYYDKQSATDAIKIASKTIQKIAEATGHIIGNKIANQIAKTRYRIIQ